MATSTQTTDKVKFESLVNATVKANNSTDTDRIFAIEANVTIRNNEVETVDSGTVNNLAGNVALANFSKYSYGGLSVNFTTEVNESEQCNVLSAINSFIADIKTKVLASPSSIASL